MTSPAWEIYSYPLDEFEALAFRPDGCIVALEYLGVGNGLLGQIIRRHCRTPPITFESLVQ